MVIHIKKFTAITLGAILVLLGISFLLYGFFGMDGSEKIISRSTNVLLERELDPDKPMVALTYDDGPYTPVTGRILDSLNSAGGKATFFIVGSRIAGREEIVRRIADSGNEIGNHTYDHIILTKTSNDNAISQIKRADEIILKTADVETRLLRPPCGCYNKTIKNEINKSFVMWTIDTMDWSHQNKDKTVERVLSKVKDGDIVLMHDLFVPTAEASEILIPELVKRGFQLVTVSELIKYKGEISGIILNNS